MEREPSKKDIEDLLPPLLPGLYPKEDIELFRKAGRGLGIRVRVLAQAGDYYQYAERLNRQTPTWGLESGQPRPFEGRVPEGKVYAQISAKTRKDYDLFNQKVDKLREQQKNTPSSK